MPPPVNRSEPPCSQPPLPAVRWRAAWLGWFGVVAGLVFTAWLVGRGPPPTSVGPVLDVARSARAASPVGADPIDAAAGAAMPIVRPSPVVPPAARETTTPDAAAGLTAQEIADLRAELAGRPDAEAELQRIVDYRGFAARWTHFIERRDAGAPTLELRPSAQALDRELDERWRRHEVTAGEAALIKSALLDVIEPDAADRLERLQAWRAHGPGAPGPSSGAPR